MTSPSSPSHKFTVKTVDRFRSPNCDVNGHPNSHITKAAALKCAGVKDEANVKLSTVSRFFGVKDSKQCECRYGHKSRESALSCVGSRPAAAKAPAAKKPAQSKASAKPASGKATAPAKPRALRSVTQGSAQRS